MRTYYSLMSAYVRTVHYYIFYDVGYYEQERTKYTLLASAQRMLLYITSIVEVCIPIKSVNSFT